jgi:hypothetical protein
MDKNNRRSVTLVARKVVMKERWHSSESPAAIGIQIDSLFVWLVINGWC